MEFSPRFIQNIMGVFSNMDYRGVGFLGPNLNLDSNNVFSRSLIIDVSNNEVEIPVIAKSNFENIILSKINFPETSQFNKIILPLYNNSSDTELKTFDSIMRWVFKNVSYGSRLQKVITYKGEVYYIGRGIIFDENYTPLLLCSLLARRYDGCNNKVMVYYRPVCHINPKVFSEPDKLINKGIIKKLIPCYTNNDINYWTTDYKFKEDFESEKVKVIIDNFDKFFIKPVKPTPSTCSNDILNKCLVDNIEDIMMLI